MVSRGLFLLYQKVMGATNRSQIHPPHPAIPESFSLVVIQHIIQAMLA